MKIPNFFIIGAPKCGTTALHSYLGQHPNIYVSRVKEPHFFCTDLPNHRRYVDRQAYLRLFRDARSDHRVVGESSARYVYSDVAIENILEFNPDAKFIAMLRNPVELADSLHSQLIYDFTEDEPNFEVAWELQSQRAQGHHIPRRCRCPEDLQYGRLAKLGVRVEHLLQRVPSGRLMLILFDDFKASPRSVYDKVLDFLEVPSNFHPLFERVNASKVWRYPAIARFLSNPPFPLDKVKSSIKRSLRLMETSFATSTYARLTVPKERVPLSDEMRANLVSYFREDIEKSSSLLSRDLSHWLVSPSADNAVRHSCVPKVDSRRRTCVASE